MPPKRKNNKSTAKSVDNSKSKASNGGCELRPKKGLNFKELNDGSKPAKAKKVAKKVPEKTNVEDDGVSLTPDSDMDDLDSDTREGDSDKNKSNSATPESECNETEDSASSRDRSKENSDDEDVRLNKKVAKMFGECMRQMKRKKKSKNRRKKSKWSKRDRTVSSSESNDSESDSSSDSCSERDSSSEYSEESSDGGKRGKKSSSKKRKKSSSKKHKGKSTAKSKVSSNLVKAGDTIDSPSQSTVYTRGCKSPQNMVVNGSSDTDSQKSGHIDSGADTDEFISSLQNSINHSSPIADRRASRDRERDPADRQSADEVRQRRLAEQEETSRREALAQDRADDVIRDIQRNKADLAKPTGEWERELQTLLIDMKHFHLTSHVDRKLRESILEGDFTVDFRRLVPQSRSHCKTDNRLQVVNNDGRSYFVPADKDNFKDITGYKQWEVAFKVFMGVYLTKWPERAGELLEYSHVIQTASLTYPWESVYNYDIAIRELMTDKPNRLWGSICHHTWAIELGEPMGKMNTVVSNSFGSGNMNRQYKKICWKFNKGRCNFGANCEFDHRCSVCGGRNHGRHNCYKRGRNQERNRESRDRVDVKRERSDR